MSDRLVIAEIERQVREAEATNTYSKYVSYGTKPHTLKPQNRTTSKPDNVDEDTPPPFPTFSQILGGEHKTWIP